MITSEAHSGLASRAITALHQQWCGMRGHTEMLRQTKAHIYLECCDCGHESPGIWLTETAPPRVTQAGEVLRGLA